MTIYIAGVFQLDTVMAALENTFGKESRREAALVPPRPDIVHTYARPEGERVRTFLHDLQTQFACTLELIEPLDDYKTEADYERETCDQLAGLCLEDRIDQIRSSSADPPFTSISWDAACDAVFCCKSVSLSVSARPHDWKGAMTVAVTELCKLGQFGISADELALAKSTLLKDMEDDAEQNDTIPSLDWLEDLMDRETLHVRCAQTRKMRLRTDTCAHALTRMQCQLIRTDGPSDRGVSSSLVTEVSHLTRMQCQLTRIDGAARLLRQAAGPRAAAPRASADYAGHGECAMPLDRGADCNAAPRRQPVRRDAVWTCRPACGDARQE